MLVGSLAEEIQRAEKRLPVGARGEVRASFCDLTVHGDQWSRYCGFDFFTPSFPHGTSGGVKMYMRVVM